MSASVNAGIDEVAFQVARQGAEFFVTISATVGPDGVARATLKGLRNASIYVVQARSHQAGGDPGYWRTWSTLVESHGCPVSVAPTTSLGAGGQALGAGWDRSVSTRWVEMFRVNSDPEIDFLSQHNSGDLSSSTSGAFDLGTPDTLFTRYCVEILDVSLPEVITSDPVADPKMSHFANFQSCNHGNCECMNQRDRGCAREPAAFIKNMCHYPQDIKTSFGKNFCNCSELSSQQSSRYVGRAAIPSPFRTWTALRDWKDASAHIDFPSDYPGPISKPYGWWYSMPRAGHCKPGAKVGDDGCTWQAHPEAFTIRVKDYLECLSAGHDFPIVLDKDFTTMTDAGLDLCIRKVDRSFHELPMALPACRQPRPEENEDDAVIAM